jgi:uncharacterized protein YlxW (UPF0749 family)
MVLGICRRILKHHDDAKDAFQASFLILARNKLKVLADRHGSEDHPDLRKLKADLELARKQQADLSDQVQELQKSVRDERERRRSSDNLQHRIEPRNRLLLEVDEKLPRMELFGKLP